MRLELLFFEDCPSWQVALENLKEAIEQAGLHCDIHLTLVENESEAARLKFLGSPSIHWNGKDLWPAHRENHFLSCRMYNTPDGRKGFPTVGMIRERLRELSST